MGRATADGGDRIQGEVGRGQGAPSVLQGYPGRLVMKLTHRFAELTPEQRPPGPAARRDRLALRDDGVWWVYPGTMPQVIKLTDAQGHSCIYVPIAQNGKVVDSQGFRGGGDERQLKLLGRATRPWNFAFVRRLYSFHSGKRWPQLADKLGRSRRSSIRNPPQTPT